MYHYPADIDTEPEPDADTLAYLGPLTGMAGLWSAAGLRKIAEPTPNPTALAAQQTTGP